jgi:hypothetical protein
MVLLDFVSDVLNKAKAIGVVFTSLEPILVLCVPHGVVYSPSLEFVITFSRHVVIVGMVSYLLVVSIILSSKHVGEFGSSMSMAIKLLVSTNWSISLLETSTSDSYGSYFVS